MCELGTVRGSSAAARRLPSWDRRRAAFEGALTQQPVPPGQGQALVLAQLQVGVVAPAWQTQ